EAVAQEAFPAVEASLRKLVGLHAALVRTFKGEYHLASGGTLEPGKRPVSELPSELDGVALDPRPFKLPAGVGEEPAVGPARDDLVKQEVIRPRGDLPGVGLREV